MNDHITWQFYEPREARWARLGQGPAIAWLTGLPGAGKTSLASAVDRTLAEYGRHVFVLDGDNLRHGLCRDLGFSEADRAENVRRAAEVARLMAQAGLIVLVALVSPSRAERARARAITGNLPFLEVFVDTPLAVCEARDPKGLYALARAGRLTDFTGISAPFEAPEVPDLTLRTEGLTIAASAAPLCGALLRLSSSDA
ncbi:MULTISPECIES: adenylyl-sulfate kinase [unclassified Methylobacterium]|uniref:adenylyl-sulfate kinase n=1 Tax=unclassified Methylobacterium TaxID=2615210 RepID=UPI00226A2D3E|nr:MULTISPECIES: adenylyl-sulfate kinase [unclassified Methylobacterium]